MNNDSISYMQICKDEFAAIHAKLDQLDEAIRGNGKPGIQLRLDRLEQSAKRQSKLIWLVIGAVVSAVASGIFAWMGG